jgi:hypothetical protein
VDQVGEPGFGFFVLGLYVEHLLGGLGRGLARSASAELHLQVLETVIAAVPAKPANSPLPKFAAMSPILVLIS